MLNVWSSERTRAWRLISSIVGFSVVWFQAHWFASFARRSLGCLETLYIISSAPEEELYCLISVRLFKCKLKYFLRSIERSHTNINSQILIVQRNQHFTCYCKSFKSFDAIVARRSLHSTTSKLHFRALCLFPLVTQ